MACEPCIRLKSNTWPTAIPVIPTPILQPFEQAYYPIPAFRCSEQQWVNPG